MPTRSRYVHGTTPSEQRRLTGLNRLLNEASIRELRVPRGARIADFGSGLGQMSRAMARAAGPHGRVLGIEWSPEQIEEAQRQARGARERSRVEFRRGDVQDPPIAEREWGRFDLAHGRFILEHVPDPLAVVRHMVRAVRPGGRIVLADDDHDLLRLWPEPVGFSAMWNAYMRSYDRHGNDPFIGRRLVELLHRAGAEPLRNTGLFFGACSGHPDFAPFVANIIAILEVARSAVVPAGLLDGAVYDDALRALPAWGRRPDAAIWFTMSWAEGVRPAVARRRRSA